ncbi:outer membrane beta-barrel protein [Stenotrophomonas bentonitica]
MRKMLVLAAALLAAAPMAASAADAMSYTYVEGGWTQLRVDVPGQSSFNWNGGYVRGSFAIAEQVHVFGGWSRVSDKTNYVGQSVEYTFDQPHLGIGYHMPFTDRLDFTADLAWKRRSAETKYRSDLFGNERLKYDVNTGAVNVGVRGKPSRMTEAWVKAGYFDGSDTDGEWTGTVGGQVNFTRTWGLVGEALFYDRFAEYSVGVRASF